MESSFQVSTRPLTPQEWIDMLHEDFNHPLCPTNKYDKMPVGYEVEWDFDGPDMYFCSMTGHFVKGNNLYFTYKRNEPKSVSYTFTEVLDILKQNMEKRIYLFDLDNYKEHEAYYGHCIGLTFFSAIANRQNP